MRASSRPGSSQRQRSPGKRSLSDSSDHGNATPRSLAGSSNDVENRVKRSISPVGASVSDSMFKSHDNETHELTFAPHRTIARFDRSNGSLGGFSAKSSPLKRSDGIMNFDQASLGSPSAKRRSLHGGTFSPDFNIFDHEAAFESHHDIRQADDGSRADGTASSDYSPIQSPLPKRTSSLRKTTLQQRHEKPTFARSKPNTDLALDLSTPGPIVPKGRFRMSLDNFLPSMTRDSPFSSQGSLPNASAHPISQHSNKPSGSGSQNQVHRHPLSRTLTQSSSNSSMAEDSPTHIPIRQLEPRKTTVDFSKSMPLGAARPASRETVSHNISSQVSSTEASVATPDNYKLAKPLPAAFMSTGLISKRNRHIDATQSDFRSNKDHMPDTPCKRHSLLVTAVPAVGPELAVSKARQVRHSFGTPSTPFSSHASRPASGTCGKGASIFGSNFTHNGINRRGSFLSAEEEGCSQSLHGKGDSQSSADFELPPTPTKQALGTGCGQSIHAQGISSTQETARPGFGVSTSNGAQSSQFESSCKSTPINSPSRSLHEGSDISIDKSLSAALRFKGFSLKSSSLTHSRLLRNCKFPAPLHKTFYTSSSHLGAKSETKSGPLSPASPVNDLLERMSPHTPRGSFIPPDPSSLSISGNGDIHGIRPINQVISSPSASTFLPATPTTSRDSFAHFAKTRSSIHSINGHATVDVDPSLTSRFEKVEMIGTGEFSCVYRVTQAQEVKTGGTYFSLPPKRTPPKTPLPDRVWAVKKSRHAYIGPKDRQRKLQEVTALRALGPADHTVQLFDSWEENNHLYIQTEFCEEGSLNTFLDQVGRKARLDDFRIWKIMLELTLVSHC